ncbi:MAG: DUF4832 domain-containing protein [Clostridia bacterium]|nr:DUF4832 domain-containing protein [Clostridia bacterium]
MSDKKVLGFMAIIIAAIVALLCAVLIPMNCASLAPDNGSSDGGTGGGTGSGSTPPAENVRNESTAQINNPDQGFYHPILVRVKEDGISYAQYVVTDSTQLYHLRIDISAFSAAVNGSADKELTASALEGIEGVLQYLRSRGKNAVVRFAYDPNYGGASNKEPSMKMMLRHIGQVCPILNKYPATITAVEVGLLGPWGEMHSSAVATLENKVALTSKYLDNTDDLAILVRTPNIIYSYLGITVNDIDGYVVPESSPAYRLGMYNDGYLGSNTDLGTYTDREREIDFMSVQNERLPYGGEVVTPDSSLHDIDKCLPEMFEMGLSYLNVEWNNLVIDKWKASYYTSACGDDGLYYGSTAFDYIQNHMGYRLVLTDGTLSYSNGEISVSLKIDNVGFGNLTKSKLVKLIFEDEEGGVTEADAGVYFGGNVEIKSACVLSGEYKVYLCLYGEEYAGKPNYAVQLANNDIWNDDYKANFIGSIKIN